VIAAASSAAFWHLDRSTSIGALRGPRVARARAEDPEMFLSRLVIVAEGATEVGFVRCLLDRCGLSPLDAAGVYVADGGGNDDALGLLEALSAGGVHFGAFVDNEGTAPTRWQKVGSRARKLFFQWPSGCTERNVISLMPEADLTCLLLDGEGREIGERRATLATRLSLPKASLEQIRAAAGDGFRELIIEAATGRVPDGTPPQETKSFRKHQQQWFKSVRGGQELADTVFRFGIWPKLSEWLSPFCDAVRDIVSQPTTEAEQ